MFNIAATRGSAMPNVQSIIHQAFTALLHRRAKQLASRELLRLGPARLEDLGVDPFALREALMRSSRRQPQPATQPLQRSITA